MDKETKALYIIIALFVLSIGAIATMIFVDDQLVENRYYECLYALKGASVSPADLLLLCDRS